MVFWYQKTTQNLVLRNIAGQKLVIPVHTVTRKQNREKCLMPDLENARLNEQNLADIVGYLQKVSKETKQQ